MLAYILALVVGLGSLALYMAAFFFPEVHRKADFGWSAVGLFYALVLWVCAGRITGGLLLGQAASVALLGWFGWQTVTLRRSLTSPEARTEISPEAQEKLEGLSPARLGQQLQQQASGLFKKGESATRTALTSPEEQEAIASPPKAAPVADAIQVTPETDTTPIPETSEEPAGENAELSESPELTRPNPPDPKLVEAARESAPHDAAIPIEEIPPDAELAPPAEPPGDGDPQMRQNPPDADIELEAVPIDPENPPKLS